MKKRRKTILVSIVCILGIIISGVLVFQQPRGSEKQKRIIFISKTIDQENDFWVQLTDGATMAAKENGMELTVVAPETRCDHCGSQQQYQNCCGSGGCEKERNSGGAGGFGCRK